MDGGILGTRAPSRSFSAQDARLNTTLAITTGSDMADWFKFYENGLDEPRFQYAVGTLSEVTPVWVGILSECCRHKSDTINWNDDEAYLFGFSRRLNVSIPKVNEALNLLQRIAYIEISNGTLKVIKWNEFQSEYMKRIHRNNPKRVRRVSEHSPNSVRREEKREDEIEEREKIIKASDSIITNARIALHDLNHKSGKSFREVDSSLSPIIQRLSEPDVTIEGVRTMISRQVAMWQGTNMAEYLRPSTLFGKEKFNGYYASKDQPIISGKTNSLNPAADRRNAGTVTGATDYGAAGQRKLAKQEADRVAKLATQNEPQPPTAPGDV